MEKQMEDKIIFKGVCIGFVKDDIVQFEEAD